MTIYYSNTVALRSVKYIEFLFLCWDTCTGSFHIRMQDAFIDRGEESFGEAVLAGSATDWSVLNIVQEALNCAETVDFKDQS